MTFNFLSNAVLILLKKLEQIKTNSLFLYFKGRYQASVTVKGKDFMSSVGDVCPNSCEARGSAAARILAKLRTLLNADN